MYMQESSDPKAFRGGSSTTAKIVTAHPFRNRVAPELRLTLVRGLATGAEWISSLSRSYKSSSAPHRNRNRAGVTRGQQERGVLDNDRI